MDTIHIILVSTSIIFWILDLFILPVIIIKNFPLENRYYNFHKKYGVKRTTILKFLFGFVIIYLLIASPFYIEAIPIVFFYIGYLTLSFFRTWQKRFGGTEIDFTTIRNPLDSLTGFLAYPFEYLDTGKPFFETKDKKLKWSWNAFLFPEWWYFSNEMLGAGYISWALLILYLGISLNSGVLSLIIIVLFRLVSGMLGPKVYYAKVGQYP